MRILYHHRTRSTDAQRIHILAIMNAFRELGHEVNEAALVSAATQLDNASRDAGEASWKRWIRRLPFAYDLIQLAYNVIGLPLLLRPLPGGRVDFIYERYSLFNFSGVLAARLRRIPIVLEVNSPFALEQTRDRDIRWSGLARWSERQICNAADLVIVVSTPLRKILAGSGVRDNKIAVMPNGVDRARFHPAKPDTGLRNRYGIGDRVVIGFVGWFRDWHGLRALLDAQRSSSALRRSATLLLVGDGPEMPVLQEFVTRHHLQREVIFSGPLPHNQVADHVAIFDVAVQPAANEYCCPMKVIEYLAMGKPVVAPRQTNILDLVEDGRQALLFTPGNTASLGGALEQLVSNSELRQRMARTAALTIERKRLLWTENASRVIDLLSHHRGGAGQTAGRGREEATAPD